MHVLQEAAKTNRQTQIPDNSQGRKKTPIKMFKQRKMIYFRPSKQSYLGIILRAYAKFQDSDYLLRQVCLSFRQSAWNYSAPTGRIFMKHGI